MLIPDLYFNLLLLAVDVAACVFLHTQRRKAGALTRILMVIVIFALAAGMLAVGIAEVFRFRVFAVFRFVGHAGALHLPALLLFGAWAYRDRAPVSRAALAGATLLFATAIYAYHIEPYRLEITEFRMTSPALEGLSRPIRILQVADIQTDRFGAYERRVFEAIRRLDADMIVYLGDYVQTRDPRAYDQLGAEFNRLLREAGLDPPLGSYAVEGDCDWRHPWESLFEGTGVRILADEAIAISGPGVALNLIGLKLATSRSADPDLLSLAAPAARPEGFDLFLGHAPDFATHLKDTDQPFLALAGHTHGGQVRIPFVGPPITFSRLERNTADAFMTWGSGHLSVSRGIGMERIEAPRLRLLCRPELRVVTLMPPSMDDGSAGASGMLEVRTRASNVEGLRMNALRASRGHPSRMRMDR